MANPVTIPINPIPAQSLQVPLSGQQMQLDFQQRSTGLYVDIWMNGARVISGVHCQDRTWIVARPSYGMPGDFVFLDTMGNTDPAYAGIGTQYVLFYQDGQNVG